MQLNENMHVPKFIICLLLAAKVFLLPPCCAFTRVDVTTPEGFIQAVLNFSISGANTEIRLQRNLTLKSADTTNWPITNMARGTLRVVPDADLIRANIPLFLDGGMLTMPMTEPFTGAVLEVRHDLTGSW